MSKLNDAFPPSEPSNRLMRAVQRKDIKSMEESLDQGADINTRDAQGFTPLIHAARQGFLEGINLLLDRGAEIDQIDNQKSSALLWACFFGRIEAATLLADRGADLNTLGQHGTALTCAAFIGHKDIVRMLLGRGADPRKQDLKGNTASDLAQKKKRADIADMLHEAILQNLRGSIKEAAQRRKPKPKFKP